MKDDYEEALDFDKRMKRDPFRKILFDKMLKMVEIEGNEKILDVGVGTGILEEIIANSITTGMIIGLDKAKARLKVALSKKIFNTFLIISTAEKLPLKSEVFNYSFCILALHHFKNHLLALKEIHRALKKNGKLILCEIIGSLNLTINKIVNEAFQISHGPDHVVFNMEQLEKLSNEAGF